MASTESTVPLSEIPYKTCSICQQAFPATPEHFYRDRRRAQHGLTARCRFCAKAYRDTHKDQHHAYRKKYQKSHPERVSQSRKKYYDAHKEKIATYDRAYRALHPERVRARMRRYGKANPDKMRAYYIRARTRKLALPVHYTDAMWQTACTYFQQTCAVCGREEGLFWMLVQDHWIPLADASCPGTVASNMVPLCHPRSGRYLSCNSTKSKQDPLTWLTAKLGTRKALEMLTKIETFLAYMQERFPL